MSRMKLDPRERERILSFATQWMPYGGGQAEEIMVTFGVAPDIYFRRLSALLTDADPLGDLDRQTIDALLDVCHRRLHAAQADGTDLFAAG